MTLDGRGPVLGVDFGTTNTVLSLITDAKVQSLVSFAVPGGRATAFRSVLSFREDARPRQTRRIDAGPWAVEAYLQDPVDTRFIQSFKTFAASPLFQSTEIFGRRYSFEDLLSAFLTQLRLHCQDQLGNSAAPVVIGRPVAFAGSSPEPSLALSRYDTAFRRVGFERLYYVYEPVGAAFYLAERLRSGAVVLVADFGGGTSDFSVVRFYPNGAGVVPRPLGHAGVAVAGDAFDYRIIDNVVSPALGKGSSYRSLEKILPVSNKYFSAFARWSQLAMLKSSRELRELKSLSRTALDPRLKALVELIEDDHGYPLYRAVSDVKEALSTEEAAPFSFQAGEISIEARVSRSDFERWIAPELEQIDRAVSEAIARAGLAASAVDKVFLTGGTSLTPAVRRLFADRFGPESIAAGGEFDSVASGLALIGSSEHLSAWSETLST